MFIADAIDHGEDGQIACKYFIRDLKSFGHQAEPKILNLRVSRFGLLTQVICLKVMANGSAHSGLVMLMFLCVKLPVDWSFKQQSKNLPQYSTATTWNQRNTLK